MPEKTELVGGGLETSGGRDDSRVGNVRQKQAERELRRQAAEDADLDPGQINVVERDGRLVAEVSGTGKEILKQRQREQLRERYAEEVGVDPGGVEIVEEDGKFVAQLKESGKREAFKKQVAEETGVPVEEIELRKTEGDVYVPERKSAGGDGESDSGLGFDIGDPSLGGPFGDGGGDSRFGGGFDGDIPEQAEGLSELAREFYRSKYEDELKQTEKRLEDAYNAHKRKLLTSDVGFSLTDEGELVMGLNRSGGKKVAAVQAGRRQQLKEQRQEAKEKAEEDIRQELKRRVATKSPYLQRDDVVVREENGTFTGTVADDWLDPEDKRSERFLREEVQKPNVSATASKGQVGEVEAIKDLKRATTGAGIGSVLEVEKVPVEMKIQAAKEATVGEGIGFTPAGLRRARSLQRQRQWANAIQPVFDYLVRSAARQGAIEEFNREHKVGFSLGEEFILEETNPRRQARQAKDFLQNLVGHAEEAIPGNQQATAEDIKRHLDIDESAVPETGTQLALNPTGRRRLLASQAARAPEDRSVDLDGLRQVEDLSTLHFDEEGRLEDVEPEPGYFQLVFGPKGKRERDITGAIVGGAGAIGGAANPILDPAVGAGADVAAGLEKSAPAQWVLGPKSREEKAVWREVGQTAKGLGMLGEAVNKTVFEPTGETVAAAVAFPIESAEAQLGYHSPVEDYTGRTIETAFALPGAALQAPQGAVELGDTAFEGANYAAEQLTEKGVPAGTAAVGAAAVPVLARAGVQGGKEVVRNPGGTALRLGVESAVGTVALSRVERARTGLSGLKASFKGPTVPYETLTSNRVASALRQGADDVLPEFRTSTAAPTKEAAEEIRERAADQPEDLQNLGKIDDYGLHHALAYRAGESFERRLVAADDFNYRLRREAGKTIRRAEETVGEGIVRGREALDVALQPADAVGSRIDEAVGRGIKSTEQVLEPAVVRGRAAVDRRLEAAADFGYRLRRETGATIEATGDLLAGGTEIIRRGGVRTREGVRQGAAAVRSPVERAVGRGQSSLESRLHAAGDYGFRLNRETGATIDALGGVLAEGQEATLAVNARTREGANQAVRTGRRLTQTGVVTGREALEPHLAWAGEMGYAIRSQSGRALTRGEEAYTRTLDVGQTAGRRARQSVESGVVRGQEALSTVAGVRPNVDVEVDQFLPSRSGADLLSSLETRGRQSLDSRMSAVGDYGSRLGRETRETVEGTVRAGDRSLTAGARLGQHAREGAALRVGAGREAFDEAFRAAEAAGVRLSEPVSAAATRGRSEIEEVFDAAQRAGVRLREPVDRTLARGQASLDPRLESVRDFGFRLRREAGATISTAEDLVYRPLAAGKQLRRRASARAQDFVEDVEARRPEDEGFGESFLLRSEDTPLPGGGFEALEGRYELPGLFTSPDLSPLRHAIGGRGYNWALRWPRLRGPGEQTTAFSFERIGEMPDWADEFGRVFEEQGKLGRVLGKDDDSYPDPEASGYQFLTEEAETGVAYVRPPGRKSELETVFPPGSQFVEAGEFAVDVFGRRKIPGRAYEYVGRGDPEEVAEEVEDVTEADLISGSDVPRTRIGESEGDPIGPPLTGGVSSTFPRQPGSVGGGASLGGRSNVRVSVARGARRDAPEEGAFELASEIRRYHQTLSSRSDAQSEQLSDSVTAGSTSLSVSDVAVTESLSSRGRTSGSGGSTSRTGESGSSRATTRQVSYSGLSGAMREASDGFSDISVSVSGSGGGSWGGFYIPPTPPTPPTIPLDRDLDLAGKPPDHEPDRIPQEGTQPRPIEPGWYNEYTVDLALGPTVSQSPGEETLSAQPAVSKLNQTLPTATEVSGTQAEQEAIEEASEFLAFGGDEPAAETFFGDSADDGDAPDFFGFDPSAHENGGWF